jgi:hypothetical protein
MITRTALSAPIRLGSSWVRHQAEEALGKGDRGGRAGQGAVVAVQRQLQAAAQRRAVEEREGGDVEVADPGEDPVALLRDRQRLGAFGDQADPGDVGAGGEDERLAGDADGGDLRTTGRDLVQRLVE